MEYEKTIKEAEKLALTLILKKARKTIGIYYYIWGFYELYITFIFTVIYNLKVTNAVISSLSFFAFVIPLYYTFKLFKDINWEYVVFRHKVKDLEKMKKQFNYAYIIYTVLILLFILVFIIIIPNITTSEIIALGSAYVYMGFIMFNLYISIYSKRRIVEPRYYDLLAIVSLAFMPLVMVGSVSFIIAFSISMLVAMVWIYAGFRSVLEVAEIE